MQRNICWWIVDDFSLIFDGIWDFLIFPQHLCGWVSLTPWRKRFVVIAGFPLSGPRRGNAKLLSLLSLDPSPSCKQIARIVKKIDRSSRLSSISLFYLSKLAFCNFIQLEKWSAKRGASFLILYQKDVYSISMFYLSKLAFCNFIQLEKWSAKRGVSFLLLYQQKCVHYFFVLQFEIGVL